MKKRYYISLFLMLLSATAAMAQVTFEAKVSKKKLGINERLRVDFQMNKDGDNFSPPAFSDFDVIGGPNQSVSNSWINGVRSFSKTYSYFLAPKKQGNFTIKQATIEIDGNTYKTSPINVRVTGAVSSPNGETAPETIAEENIHLVAEISDATPYLNQAITVVYKLYVSPTTGVSDMRETDSPKFSDFWSQNIEINGLKVQNTTYKGEDYRVAVWRKVVLYPQKTGKLELEPLSISVAVEVPTNRRDIFGGRLMTRVNRTISAGKRTIDVKPLPIEGKPDDFTGAVGEFTFNVTTSKTELNATESLQAKVEVKGKGNLKLFNLPKLEVPNSLEIYEPEHKEDVRTNLGGMQGSISDNYTIVPQYKGKYPIPSFSFSYFDIKSASYKTLNSEELLVDVLEGPTNSSALASAGNTDANKSPVVLNDEQFRYLKTKGGPYGYSTSLFF